ncbi:MAG: polymorphic toxin type 44 domain-containing protein [Rickettsiales bacterium]|nr:polymorphic toxin type 44 domain-containing protein [Rickettsiales bacterium]
MVKILTKEEFKNQSFKYWLKSGIMYDDYDHYLNFLKTEYKSEFNTTRRLYIWRSQDDNKVRASHQQYDDQIFDWNDEDMIKPGEDYGCRCYAEFLDGDENPNGEYGKIAWPDKEIESDPKPYYEPCDKNGTPLNKKQWKELTTKEKELRKQEELEKFKNSDTLKENIKEAEEMRKKFGYTNPIDKGEWFKGKVKSGGPWDYKKDGHPEMEHVGNFNYGATGNALGFSEIILKIFAGKNQIENNTSSPDFWDSWFDDPVDQEMIEQGFEWYDNNQQ